MKVKIEMIVEVSREVEAWDIESHVNDALIMYEGNDLEFMNCKISKCIPTLPRFEEHHAGKVICLETFNATHANSIGGERIENHKTFVEGIIYQAESWRPEGMHIGGFFVFNENACKFAKLN